MSEKKIFEGKIEGKIIEVRFASSGKLAGIYKTKGNIVKKGQIIASLDKKLLQAELDRQLGDFEKIRAEFEIHNLKTGEPKDDIAKYLKTEKQAELNISVKEVEIAKARLDQTDLFSPIDGIIIDDSNLVSEVFLTPASSPIKILDVSSYAFVFEIDQKDLPVFIEPRLMEINIEGAGKTFKGTTRPIAPREDGKFKIEAKPDDSSGLILGLCGQATIIS